MGILEKIADIEKEVSFCCFVCLWVCLHDMPSMAHFHLLARFFYLQMARTQSTYCPSLLSAATRILLRCTSIHVSIRAHVTKLLLLFLHPSVQETRPRRAI